MAKSISILVLCDARATNAQPYGQPDLPHKPAQDRLPSTLGITLRSIILLCGRFALASAIMFVFLLLVLRSAQIFGLSDWLNLRNSWVLGSLPFAVAFWFWAVGPLPWFQPRSHECAPTPVQDGRSYMKGLLVVLTIIALAWIFPMSFCSRLPNECAYSPLLEIHQSISEAHSRYSYYLFAAFLAYAVLIVLFFGREVAAEFRKVSMSRVLGRVLLMATLLAAYAFYQLGWLS